MTAETQLVALQATVIEQALLTVLQALVVAGFLGVSALAAHLLVRAFRSENGELRLRDARLMLGGASVLFIVGFARLVVTDGAPSESLAGLALGFAGVTYLLYTVRPELFKLADRDETATSVEDPAN
jgi:hypothetical protein